MHEAMAEKVFPQDSVNRCWKETIVSIFQRISQILLHQKSVYMIGYDQEKRELNMKPFLKMLFVKIGLRGGDVAVRLGYAIKQEMFKIPHISEKTV